MMDSSRNKGAFQIARQIFDSEIWTEKPSTWKIIFIYILGNVKHTNTDRFKRGEGFFNFRQELRNIGNDITEDMVKKSLQYFRRVGILSTKRSTRGVVVKVLNYNKFQTLNNYSSTNQSTSQAREKHERSTPILKNVKNDKNVKKKEKHKYGEYSNVLLTNNQYNDLKDKVDNRDKWIKTMDESIEEKGNIYHIKNFYLALIRWYKRDLDKTPQKRKIVGYAYICPECKKEYKFKDQRDFHYRCSENQCQQIPKDNGLVGHFLEYKKTIYKKNL